MVEPNYDQEPHVVINGVELTRAQSMTLRVALGSFLMGFNDPNYLGNDEHGRAMRMGYLARGGEISKIMHSIYK